MLALSHPCGAGHAWLSGSRGPLLGHVAAALVAAFADAGHPPPLSRLYLLIAWGEAAEAAVQQRLQQLDADGQLDDGAFEHLAPGLSLSDASFDVSKQPPIASCSGEKVTVTFGPRLQVGPTGCQSAGSRVGAPPATPAQALSVCLPLLSHTHLPLKFGLPPTPAAAPQATQGPFQLLAEIKRSDFFNIAWHQMQAGFTVLRQAAVNGKVAATECRADTPLENAGGTRRLVELQLQLSGEGARRGVATGHLKRGSPRQAGR